MNSGQYIYGVIPAPVPAGIGRDGLRIVAHEDIAAMVSCSDPVDITKMRKDALARMLVAHQKVIESAMQFVADVIPFRLGTYAGSENETMEILANGQKLIRRIFSEIGGKIEMDVAVTWADFAAILKEVGAEDEINKLKQSFAGNPRGVSVDDQLKIGLMIKKALDRKKMMISRQIAVRLAAAACARSRYENMDDQTVMSEAFLIEQSRRSEFERSLDELNGQLAEKVKFRCVGPLPPYSFYTLELKKIAWEDVDWARRVMRLGVAASAEDIKKAFQHSALATHPDHAANSAETERAFNELNTARGIILEYAAACKQTAAADQFFFNEENVRRNSFLIRIRNGNNHG